MFPQEASERLCAGGCLPRHSAAKAGLSRRVLRSLQRERASAFTLLELLIVVGIIAVLLVLIAPAFTTLKSAGDVTSAAYTIKGVLDTARTYAKANNTYTWVGFCRGECVLTATPTHPAHRHIQGTSRYGDRCVKGRNNDLQKLGTPVTLTYQIDNLLQVGKLT